MELKKINDTIYYLENEVLRDRPVLGYVLGEKYSIMIDCGNSKAHLELFMDELERNNLPYPKYAIISHWHWDHTFAMKHFKGDTILSRLTNDKLVYLKELDWDEDSVLERLNKKEEIEFAYKAMKEEYDDFSDIELVGGDIIFDRKLTLDMGDKTCEIIRVGGPHEEDSSIIYMVEDRVLFVGDAHSGDYYKGEGRIDPLKMKDYVDILETIDFETYIPGHSSPMKKKEIIDILSKYC